MTAYAPLSRSIADKVAIVTGAASGMGRATALLFAQEGAAVAVTDLSQTAVDAVVHEIEATGGRAVGIAADLADPASAPLVADRTREALGPIDILVNNAGVSRGAPLSSPDFEDVWAETLAVNLAAHVRLIRCCIDDLERDGAGRIVNISSTEGLQATAYISPYTVSKHGVIGLTRSLAVELGPKGVTVNAIAPGPIETGMTAGIAAEDKAKYARRRVPLRRYGNPEEVAHMTLSLVLPAASFITGAVIPVDGGLTIKST